MVNGVNRSGPFTEPYIKNILAILTPKTLTAA